MYAVIETGGKQFTVHNGDVIYVEKLDVADGESVNFDTLMISKDDGVRVGTPKLDDAKVTGIVRKQVKGEKIVIYKYKAKKNYRRKAGHRQPYTRVEITAIEG